MDYKNFIKSEEKERQLRLRKQREHEERLLLRKQYYQEMEEERQKLEVLREDRRLDSQLAISQIMLKSEERKQQIQESNLKIQEILALQKLAKPKEYPIIRQIQIEEQLKQQQVTEELKNKFKPMNMSEIFEHSNRYNASLKSRVSTERKQQKKIVKFHTSPRQKEFALLKQQYESFFNELIQDKTRTHSIPENSFTFEPEFVTQFPEFDNYNDNVFATAMENPQQNNNLKQQLDLIDLPQNGQSNKGQSEINKSEINYQIIEPQPYRGSCRKTKKYHYFQINTPHYEEKKYVNYSKILGNQYLDSLRLLPKKIRSQSKQEGVYPSKIDYLPYLKTMNKHQTPMNITNITQYTNSLDRQVKHMYTIDKKAADNLLVKSIEAKLSVLDS